MPLISQSAPDFLRPLARRERPALVVRELEALSRLPRGAALKRVQERDKTKAVSRETLVSLARTFHLAGDMEAARMALEALIVRVSGVLRQKLRGWHVGPDDREDLQQHLLAGLCGFWLDTKPGEELWECNFTTPFALRTITLIQGFFAQNTRTISLQTPGDDPADGAEQEIADPASEAVFADMIRNMPVRDALRALWEHNAAWSDAFHDKFIAGDAEEEIAARYNVSSRTVRHWITQARLFLQARLEKEDA